MKRFFFWLSIEVARFATFLIGLKLARAMGFPTWRYATWVWLVWLVLVVRKLWVSWSRGRLDVTGHGSAAIDQPWIADAHAVRFESDPVARTMRVTARTGFLRDQRDGGAGAERTKGRVDITVPLVGCRLASAGISKSVSSPIMAATSGTAMVNGQMVPVSVTTVTGYTHAERDTRSSTLRFAWQPVEKTVDARPPQRIGGQTVNGATVRSRSLFDRGITVEVIASDAVAARLVAAWEADVAPRIAAVAAQDDARLLAERLESDTRLLVAREQAAQASREEAERVARQRQEAAEARVAALLGEAGLTGDFAIGDARTDAGTPPWYIALDRSGRGLFLQADSSWHGPLAGARATLVPVAGLPAAGPTVASQLEIEVHDPGYEQTHLRRRRFHLLSGRPRTELNEWADRINILAGST